MPPVNAATPEQAAALARLERGEPAMWAVVHGDGYVHCMMADQSRAEQYAVQQRALLRRLSAGACFGANSGPTPSETGTLRPASP